MSWKCIMPKSSKSLCFFQMNLKKFQRHHSSNSSHRLSNYGIHWPMNVSSILLSLLGLPPDSSLSQLKDSKYKQAIARPYIKIEL